MIRISLINYLKLFYADRKTHEKFNKFKCTNFKNLLKNNLENGEI